MEHPWNSIEEFDTYPTKRDTIDPSPSDTCSYASALDLYVFVLVGWMIQVLNEHLHNTLINVLKYHLLKGLHIFFVFSHYNYILLCFLDISWLLKNTVRRSKVHKWKSGWLCRISWNKRLIFYMHQLRSRLSVMTLQHHGNGMQISWMKRSRAVGCKAIGYRASRCRAVGSRCVTRYNTIIFPYHWSFPINTGVHARSEQSINFVLKTYLCFV